MVNNALECGYRELSSHDTGRLDAQLLLGHTLQRTRAWLFAHKDAPLSNEQKDRYQRLLTRRKKGEPVAYLRGHVEWYGRDWEVTPDVLVPRPETELLLEMAVTLVRRRGLRTVADIGTGSGAIAVQMAVEIADLCVYAVDVSEGALLTGRRNAARHEVGSRVTFLRSNLLEAVPERPDLIIANLPYLDDSMMTELSIDVLHEPRVALYGGPTGLELYAELLAGLSHRQWYVPVFMEIDSRQSRTARQMAIDIFPSAVCTVTSDLSGRDRVVLIDFPSSESPGT